MPAFALAGAQTGRSENGEIVAFGAAAGENDFARFAFQDSGNSVARGIERGAGLLADMMNARWISKNAVHVWEHRGTDVRIERRGRVVIEINRAHLRMMHQKCGGTSRGDWGSGISDFGSGIGDFGFCGTQCCERCWNCGGTMV